MIPYSIDTGPKPFKVVSASIRAWKDLESSDKRLLDPSHALAIGDDNPAEAKSHKKQIEAPGRYEVNGVTQKVLI
jgi:hypothetical protein